MMCLKYPKPEVMTEVMPGGSVFFLPPQGKPGVADLAQPHLQRLRSQLERRLGTLHRVVCQPQRVGQSSSVAVTAEGACGEVHLLLTVGGMRAGPLKRNTGIRAGISRWWMRPICSTCCSGCVMAGRKPEKTAATGNCVVVACYWQVVYGVWAQFWPAGTCPYNL